MTLDEFENKANLQVPWQRGAWHGQFLSLEENVIAGEFKPEDIWRVFAVGNSGDQWTGIGAAVVQLHDGRWVEDIWRVFAVGNSGDQWTGIGAAVVQLYDGRWVAWESSWGPTGSGFSDDAYGHGGLCRDANVYFASSLEIAIMLGLTQTSRALLGLNTEDWSNPNAKLPELVELIHGQ